MTTSLKSIVSCNVLGLKESFQGTCFDHAFSKMCQYATTYEKIYKGLRNLSQSCPRRFAKVHNLAKTMRNG